MGAALGKERSFAKHSAGVRTMSLVALGACAFTICSIFGFAGRCDTARIAANVASGVGFIGAGVITTSTRNERNMVTGLTTAAVIWNAAAVGMACGVGLLRIATTAAIVNLGILRLGRRKPKHQSQPKSQQESWKSSQSSSHPLMPTPKEEKRSLDADADDERAEVHDTSDWDEHPDDDEEEESQLKPTETWSKSSQENDSSLMQDVVRSAWKNSTDYLDTLVPMERCESKRRSSSSRSSDYRP